MHSKIYFEKTKIMKVCLDKKMWPRIIKFHELRDEILTQETKFRQK
jgi:hypothetical protein